jgi:hypothetical protein
MEDQLIMSVNPNPQGKGLLPVLSDVQSSRARVDIPPKDIDRVTNELFTSLFVLESEFSFRPVVGREYYLYLKDGRFRLSLIRPDEWQGGIFGRYIGLCMLQRDVTWTIEMDEEAAGDEHLRRLIREKREALEKSLSDVKRLGDALPVYIESLPYYQRVFASALANSLGISMQLSGIKDLTYGEAKRMLENGK